MWALVAFLITPWGDLIPTSVLIQTSNMYDCNYYHQMALQELSKFSSPNDTFVNCVQFEEDE